MEFKRLSAYRKKDGSYSFAIQDCGQDYESKQIRRDWGRSLMYRMDEKGFFLKNAQGVIAPANANSIRDLGEIIDQITAIKNQFSNQKIASIIEKKNASTTSENIQTGFNIGGKQNLDITNDDDLRVVKRELCKLLSRVGIQITLPELQFMLDHKYKDAS